MPDIMDKSSLLKLADSIIAMDNQVKIATLSDQLTISQVVRFFERQGRNFTKTMIQNYIRVGVLPPPVDKRYYTRNHLVMLTLIDNLKAIYSLEEIKSVLDPVRNNPQIFEDDIIKTADLYNNYLYIRKEVLGKWKESLPALLDKVEGMVDEDMVEEKDRNTAAAFMTALAIMAESVSMKDLAVEVIKEYVDKSR